MKAFGSNSKGARRSNLLVRAIAWISAAVLLTGCGGGSGNSQPPPSLSYSPSSLVFVQGTAITPVVPTASQGLSSFTVTPALPTGLSLNPSNGTISGTPTALSDAATYSIIASGGGANAGASISITVNVPASVSYYSPAYTFTTNIAARDSGGPVGSIQPQVGGPAPTTLSISPPLPAGLSFDTATGTISGTPTAASAATSYVVSAQNAGGQATTTLTIEVDSGPLLDVGHDAPISLLRMSGSSVLSVDQSGHWNLWEYTSGSEIASGDLYCAPNCNNQPPVPAHLADMAGGTVVLATQNGFEVLSATSGQVISNITASVSSWSLASDGSYIAATSNAGLFAWSPSGNSQVSLSGDYSQTLLFAVPGQIQAAVSPAGQNVIQTVSVPSGTTTTSPTFTGQFSSWFLDGSRFMTTAGSTVNVYSLAGVQQATMAFPGTTPFVTGFSGTGNWIWSVVAASATAEELEVFPVASGTAPVASLAITGGRPVASGETLAISTATAIDVVDLSGTTLSETSYNSNFNLSVYAASSTSQWMVGNSSGVLLDGASLASTPRYFDWGAVSSIAGSLSSGLIAIATASDRIVYFDANTLTREGVISASASNLVLSADGSVLAAKENDGSIAIYSMPSANLLYTWSGYPPAGPGSVSGIGLSALGAILAQVIQPPPGTTLFNLQAGPATGGSPTFAFSVDAGGATLPPEVLISPNGTLFATTAGVPSARGNPGTNLWNRMNLTTGVTGYPLGWIDDGHLIVNTYAYPFPGAPAAEYAGCNVYAPSGQSTGPCALPSVSEFETVNSDSIYAVNLASILSVSTGSVRWTSGDATSNTVGAIAGNRVFVLSGTSVLAQGY